jgi:methionine synthase I (cobalamin-dependent)/5,10-methylenetetrahydrofolate reductase
MKTDELLARLEDSVLLFDGAMGTMLYASGIYVNRCFDELNLTEPAKVSEIHRRYITAGANVIETNTYGANRLKLLPFGLEDKVKEINLTAARLARNEAGKGILVGGSIGPAEQPLKAVSQVAPNVLFDVFLEQASALEEGGVDLFVLETMSDLDEIKSAVKAVRKISDKAIIAQATFNDTYHTVFDDTPEDAVRTIKEAGADVAGLNCSIGPSDSLEILKRMAAVGGIPLSVQPNAGTPKLIEGRFIYLSTPEYFAEYAKRFIQSGASVLGGCCGTTPEHIKAMRAAIRALKPGKLQVFVSLPEPERKEADKIHPIATIEKSPFARKLREKFVVSVEVNPPRGFNIESVLKKVETLRAKGIDLVNIPDGPRASLRMSSIALASIIENRTKMETLLHYTCRDRNILGMQSDLLGAHGLDLRNFLIVTGDPPKLGDYPDATAVFDIDAIGLVKILDKFNHGRDVVGNPVGYTAGFHIGVGANPGALNIELEMQRLRDKLASGGEFILTQPVYEAGRLDDFLSRTGIADVPVLVGILPLASLRMAEFLTNEVPGMEVPKYIRERLASASSKEEETEIGIEVARNVLKDSKNIRNVKGVYIMLPTGAIEAAFKIIEVL